jgi:copper chaperone
VTDKTLFVPDISCDHCKMSIENTVGGLGGVEAVSVDIPARTVELSYDEAEITLQKIIGAMAEIGYEVPAVE